MDEAQVGEEGVGHVLVEEGGWADEVEGYSVWAALKYHVSALWYSFLLLPSLDADGGMGMEKKHAHLHSIQLLLLRYNLIDMWG